MAADFTLFDRPYPVLAMRIGPLDVQGVRVREWLLQSDARCGPIRVEERVRTDEAGGRDTVLIREAFAAGEIMVRPREGVAREDFFAALSQVGAVSWQPVFGSAYWLARFPAPDLDTQPKALAGLARSAELVAAAEGNGFGTSCSAPDDPRFPEQDSLQNTGQMGGLPGADIRMVQAWELCHASPDVIVAVLDQGINYDHPDLVENMYRDPREFPANGVDDDGNGLIDDWRGWDFVGNDNDPEPSSDHATGAASIIGARGNNGLAIAGITWEVRLLNVKVNESTGGTTANLIAGINYARTKGARIMSLSLGGYPYSSATLEAIEAAGAADILLVIAAGNSGLDNDVVPFYPASYPSDNIVAVANTNNLDELNLSLSNYGPRSVDLGAPGTHLLGLGLGAGYRYGNGTSSATPHVAGVAALLRQMRPEATVADLKHWILDNVDPLPTLAGRCVSGGRLNAYAALRAAVIQPTLLVPPTSATTGTGARVVFSVLATSPTALRYQWRRDGVDLAGATAAELVLSGVSSADAGSYTVVVRNGSGGAIVTAPAALTVNAQAYTPPGSTLVNLSTRAQVGTGGNILIAGFVIGGSGSKQVLVRAVGPGLAQYLSGTLADPRLELTTLGGTVLAANDDWGTADAAAIAAGPGAPLAPGSKDAALIVTLPAGAYTALVRGVNDTTGIALVELYDLDRNSAARLINLSTRAQVGTGGSALIAGFVVVGSSPRNVLIRALGPTLSQWLTGTLPDPQLNLTTISGTPLATNDNWDATNGAAIAAAAVATGAYPLAAGTRDAALLAALPEGQYTPQITDRTGTTGLALVEVYEAP